MDDVSARRMLLKASGIDVGSALDVGMGECACMSFLLASRGFDVIGVDRSSHAVHAARQAARGRRFRGSFQARRADAEFLPFEDGQFDLVLAYRALHQAKDVEQVVREMHRVCREGGAMLVADLNDCGRRGLGHVPDNGRLVGRIARALGNLSAEVETVETHMNVMFTCHKLSAERTLSAAVGALRPCP